MVYFWQARAGVMLIDKWTTKRGENFFLFSIIIIIQRTNTRQPSMRVTIVLLVVLLALFALTIAKREVSKRRLAGFVDEEFVSHRHNRHAFLERRNFFNSDNEFQRIKAYQMKPVDVNSDSEFWHLSKHVLPRKKPIPQNKPTGGNRDNEIDPALIDKSYELVRGYLDLNKNLEADLEQEEEEMDQIKDTALFSESETEATPGQIAANYARAQVGKGYSQQNRLGPSSFDCSGLVYMAWKAAGKTVPTWTGAYPGNTRQVNNLEVGDILWSSGHVGIYVGNNQVVNAENPRTGVQLRSLDYFKRYMGYSRIYRPN